VAPGPRDLKKGFKKGFKKGLNKRFDEGFEMARPLLAYGVLVAMAKNMKTPILNCRWGNVTATLTELAGPTA
jgi:hypothetical protein